MSGNPETVERDSEIFFVQQGSTRNGINYEKIDLGSSINLSAGGISAMQFSGRAGSLRGSIDAANKFLFDREYPDSEKDRIDMHATRFLVFDAMCSGVKFPAAFAKRVLKTDTNKLDPLDKDDLAILFETCRNYEKTNPTAGLIFEKIRGGSVNGRGEQVTENITEIALALVQDLRDPFYEFVMSTEPAQIARIIDARARDDASKEEVSVAGAEFSADEFDKKFDSMPKIFQKKLIKVGEALLDRDKARGEKYSVKNFIRIVCDALAACSFRKSKNIDAALGNFVHESVKKLDKFKGIKSQLSDKAKPRVFNPSKEGGKPVGGRSF
jgi:hypothetical protein